jgi:hypothetical protein
VHVKPPRKRLSISKLAEKALRSAVSKVLAEHRKNGLPIFVWQQNKVVRIPAHRIAHK